MGLRLSPCDRVAVCEGAFRSARDRAVGIQRSGSAAQRRYCVSARPRRGLTPGI